MAGAPNITAPPTGVTAARRRGWSRAVSLLKILLPTVALALVALVVIWAQLRETDGGFHLGFSLIKPEDALTLSMVNARYAGRSRSKQPYLVTAQAAIQDRPGADLIKLTQPQGDITMKAGAWVALTAPSGNYRMTSR